MHKLAEFFYGSEDKLSMMRLVSLLTAIGGMTLIAVYPEQAAYLAPIVVGSQAFKWLQSKGGE